ncbi:lysophospholipase L1-like esterase [Opitutaceae bacterium TAV1]|nr:lysophospholipase L1-like esterase [Opitutaceae bacterium TAV1]
MTLGILKKLFTIIVVSLISIHASYADIVAWGDSLTQGAGKQKVWTTWFEEMSGIPVINKGIGGQNSTKIKTRMLAATDLHGEFTVIWAGRNNYGNTEAVLADIADMVSALGHTNYLVLGIINGLGEESTNKQGAAKLNKIKRLNAELAAIYGIRFLDIRTHLVNLYNPSNPDDASNFANDIPPSSLRYDFLHLNSAGHEAVAKFIYTSYLNLNKSSH